MNTITFDLEKFSWKCTINLFCLFHKKIASVKGKKKIQITKLKLHSKLTYILVNM